MQCFSRWRSLFSRRPSVSPIFSSVSGSTNERPLHTRRPGGDRTRRLSGVGVVPPRGLLMTSNLLIQCGVYLVVLLVLAKPLGEFFARVLSGERQFLSPVLGWLERLTYKASGVDPQHEMRWTEYAVAVLLFNFFGFLAVYLLQRFQGVLPLNPATLGAVSTDSSWNTAVSFATNTNWQGYGGESTMSYLTQMLGLAVQNFVSAATGIAVLVALIRGFVRKQVATIGNFWADLTRSTLYILLPLSFVLALVLVSQGVVQTFGPYVKAQTVEKIDYEEPKTGVD